MVAPRQPAPRPPGRHVVARTDEIPPGERIIVEVDGRQVGVFNIDGEFVAFLHRCPHMGGPLCDGRVIGLVESSGPGDVRLDETRKFLTCPLHGWEFDIHTGQSYFDPAKVRAKRSPVEVRSGADLAADGSTGDVAGEVEGTAAGDVAGTAGAASAGPTRPRRSRWSWSRTMSWSAPAVRGGDERGEAPDDHRAAGEHDRTDLWSGSVIDADVHANVPSLETPHRYQEPVWVQWAQERGWTGPAGLTIAYPPNAPTTSRDEWRLGDAPPASDLSALQRHTSTPGRSRRPS